MASGVVVEPGGGERLADRPPKRVVAVKAEHELLAVTESWFGPGQRGADLHVHRRHVDAFYVVEGEVTFRVGKDGKPLPAVAGTLVAVPPGVIHGFDNDSDAPVRYLNIHAPGMNFIEYMRARRDRRDIEAAGFDSFDPTVDGGGPVEDVLVSGPGDGDAIGAAPASGRIKAGGGLGDGTLIATEWRFPAGSSGPPLHEHRATLDSFFVLDGTLTVALDGETVDATAGSFAFVPPGSAHTFSNRGDVDVVVLNLMAPAGLEGYFRDLDALPPGPRDPDAIAEIVARYDIRLVDS
jgi:mannose-6-phosphate isomerase-like protein (cupin superfamily)